jgi:glycosyltransferase involved in cell wall biosynthesis
MPTFTIITPCLNATQLLEETLHSVLSQRALASGRASLQYIVCDGGSTDGTQDLVRRVGSSRVTLISEKDRGMYDALAKGMALGKGDIYAYLNAGDYYSPHAFDIVLEFLGRGRAQWLTGLVVGYCSKGYLVSAALPYRFRSSLIRAGLHDGRRLPMIQQESTFWTRDLQQSVDLAALARFRYAGDHFLWQTFAERARLKIVRAYLGGFRVHKGQLSEARQEYLDEMRHASRPPGLRDLLLAALDRPFWYAPNFVKKYMNAESLFVFNEATADWN